MGQQELDYTDFYANLHLAANAVEKLMKRFGRYKVITDFIEGLACGNFGDKDIEETFEKIKKLSARLSKEEREEYDEDEEFLQSLVKEGK